MADLRSRRAGTARRPEGVVEAVRQPRHLASLVAARSALVGVQGWRWCQRDQARAGGRRSTTSQRRGARATTSPRRRMRSTQIADKLRAAPRYAPRGGAAVREAALRQRRQGAARSAAAMGGRPRRRGRAQGDRALAPRARSLLDEKQYDEALKHARRQDATTRSPASTPTCAATSWLPQGKQRRSAQPRTRRRWPTIDPKSQYRAYVAGQARRARRARSDAPRRDGARSPARRK